MGKKKKKSSIPRHKRMNRAARLQAAKCWIPTYSGKKIVGGYARHFGVDLLCAVKELELLGYEFTLEYRAQLKKDKEEITKQRQARKRAKEQKEMSCYLAQDENWYYIAGYTSGGFPYGVTWEEMEHDGELALSKGNADGPLVLDPDDDDIPF